MYKVLFVLATCLLATSVLSCENGYAGDKCRRNQKTVINTKACTRTCVDIYPLSSCRNLCHEFKGPECNAKQKTIRRSCGCTKYCVDVLGEGEKCDQSNTTMCKRGLSCIDGVCSK